MPKKVSPADRKLALVGIAATTKLHAQVEQAAKRQGMSISEFGRRALSRYIAEQTTSSGQKA